jgi:hypothetical protein
MLKENQSTSFSEEKEAKRLLLLWATGRGLTTPDVPKGAVAVTTHAPES